MRLDASCFALAEVVLERAEADDGSVAVGGLVGQFRCAGNKLPTLKVDVCA